MTDTDLSDEWLAGRISDDDYFAACIEQRRREYEQRRREYRRRTFWDGFRRGYLVANLIGWPIAAAVCAVILVTGWRLR